ncbi:hypothetical protein EES41_39540 (plasmid) [Streptomyces sp. ADI95-16]|uniref:DUF7224 domain-containing protein n=1 Tax=Streptomyces sp. ADI95-16 TaxID=1522758 RepID=UPI000F3A8E72|nr:hypothetical protein [Streptomyces sp. ADI95-16]AYV32868.1 hypothetical protein EES41_39540 [Streptomyces sp. ADI95-16]
MITWANLRASAALWMVLPASVYSGLYITANRISVPTAYGVEAGEAVAQTLPVVVGAVAAVAAWEAGRHRLLGTFPATAARSALRRFVWAVTPVVVLQGVLLVVSLLLAANTVGTLPSGAGGWLGVAHALVLPLGWTAIGWRLGHILPRSLAAPVAGVGGWMFLSFPQGMANPWLRHLGGFIDGFSSPTDTRSPLAYLIPWAVLGGLVLAFWLPTLVRQRVSAISLGFALVIATILLGRSAVADWGYFRPSDARVVTPVCAGEAPRVCLPPEYASYTDGIRKDLTEPLSKLRDAGVPIPSELLLASSKEPLKPGVWPLIWSLPLANGQTNPDSFRADLAESAVTGTSVSAGVTPCRRPGSMPAAWAALVVGVNEDNVRRAMPPPAWQEITKIRTLPKEEQVAWFTEAARAQKHCGAVS